MDYLLLIDGSSLLSTQYYGNLPREIMFAKTEEEKQKYYYKIMQNSKGVYTNAVFGFMRTLIKIINEQSPVYLAIAWDKTRDTFRRELYSDYKGNRGETPKPLKDQFVLCQRILEDIGIRQFMSERYEADDYCGSLAKRFENEVPVRIITKDRDYLQLVNEKTNVFMMHSSQEKTEEIYKKYKMTRTPDIPERTFLLTPELVYKEYGVRPESVADLKGIQGDSADNIKGVPGVGEGTALALINKYKTVESLYETLESLDEKGLKELAASWKEIGISRSPINALMKKGEGIVGKEAAFLSKTLATIKCDIDLGELKLEDLMENINIKKLAECFEELEFKSLKPEIRRENSTKVEIKIEKTDDLISADEFFGKLSCKRVGAASDENGNLYIATDVENVQVIEKAGFITAAYLGTKLKELAEKGIIISEYNIKRLYKDFEMENLENAFDVEIAEYLLNPLKGSYEFTGDSVNKAVEALKKAELLEKELKDTNMYELFSELEMPLAGVLNSMENEGVLVDRDALVAFGNRLENDIRRLEASIYDRCGEKFNINSPKQLGVILFEKLRLPYGKKTKSGYSTSADVLEKLKIEDPVIEMILEYRQLSKLKSTYTDGLFDCIAEDGRIHTTFNQTVTATGRLSSTEPNLQNIPIRTELGSLIRKAFIPGEGNCFVDADYSQIELRLLAAMSKDEKLIAAYRDSEDIHTATASAVFHVPVKEVTHELRSRAKAVNFGIVYGISSFGLGNGLNISKKEAEGYISDYFMTYPGIKSYLDGLINAASEKGYAVTLYNRRRPIPELSQGTFMQRQFGERVAMNSPIQGTAADIIKIAMLAVYKRLKKEYPEAKLILQVHDELLVECPVEIKDDIIELLKATMENAVELPVRLEAGVMSGSDWLEAH